MPLKKQEMREIRCKKCKRLLLKVTDFEKIEVHCKCKTVNVFTDNRIY